MATVPPIDAMALDDNNGPLPAQDLADLAATDSLVSVPLGSPTYPTVLPTPTCYPAHSGTDLRPPRESPSTPPLDAVVHTPTAPMEAPMEAPVEVEVKPASNEAMLNTSTNSGASTSTPAKRRVATFASVDEVATNSLSHSEAEGQSATTSPGLRRVGSRKKAGVMALGMEMAKDGSFRMKRTASDDLQREVVRLKAVNADLEKRLVEEHKTATELRQCLNSDRAPKGMVSKVKSLESIVSKQEAEIQALRAKLSLASSANGVAKSSGSPPPSPSASQRARSGSGTDLKELEKGYQEKVVALQKAERRLDIALAELKSMSRERTILHEEQHSQRMREQRYKEDIDELRTAVKLRDETIQSLTERLDAVLEEHGALRESPALQEYHQESLGTPGGRRASSGQQTSRPTTPQPRSLSPGRGALPFRLDSVEAEEMLLIKEQKEVLEARVATLERERSLLAHSGRSTGMTPPESRLAVDELGRSHDSTTSPREMKEEGFAQIRKMHDGEVSTQRKIVKDRDVTIATLLQKLDQSENGAEHLRAQLNFAQQSIEQLQTAMDKQRKKVDAVIKLETECDELRMKECDQENELRALRTDVKRATKKTVELQEENAKLRDGATALGKQHDDHIASMTATLDRAQDRIRLLEAKVEELIGGSDVGSSTQTQSQTHADPMGVSRRGPSPHRSPSVTPTSFRRVPSALFASQPELTRQDSVRPLPQVNPLPTTAAKRGSIFMAFESMDPGAAWSPSISRANSVVPEPSSPSAAPPRRTSPNTSQVFECSMLQAYSNHYPADFPGLSGSRCGICVQHADLDYTRWVQVHEPVGMAMPQLAAGWEQYAHWQKLFPTEYAAWRKTGSWPV